MGAGSSPPKKEGSERHGNAFTDFLGRLNYCVGEGTTVLYPGFAGHCDWRLPTIEELATLFDPASCGNGPCIEAIFGPSQGGYFSSTTSNSGPPWGANALMLYTYSGNTAYPGKSHPFYFRAVRGRF